MTFGFFARLREPGALPRRIHGKKVLPARLEGGTMNPQNQCTVGWLIVFMGIIALAAPRLRSQSASNNQPEHFQRTFSIAPGGTLNVDNYKGTIHVTGADGNQLVVDVTKRFDGNDTDRKWWMESVEVNFQNDSNRVAVEVKYPQWNCTFCWQGHDYTAAVELEIRVPRQTNVTLESYKPDIKLASIQGDIRIKSYKSPITIDSTTGAIRIDTYKDTVKLHNVTLKGPLEVKSYKADAEIDARALGESATLESDKGTIVLRVPQNAGLDVDYEGGRRSSFHTDFALNSQAGAFDHSVRGTINSGGTRLRLRTEKGSVSLEKLSGQL
jgi:Putative adhesin